MADIAIELKTALDNSSFDAGARQYMALLDQVRLASLRAAQETARSTAQMTTQIANLSNLGGGASGLSKQFSAMTVGISAAVGTAAISLVENLISSLGRLGAKALQVVRDFDYLQFSIATLGAIELTNAGQFKTIAEANAQATLEAQGYIREMERLAVFSPFTTLQIADGFKLLTTYGMLREEALALTEATVDWASAAGVAPERYERVALAMGQVKSEGRLLAREALQFSQAGVPIRDIMAKAFDVTSENVTELMRKGLIPANSALRALIQWMNQFEGSGVAVSQTLAGVISSLQDIRELTLRDIFRGVFDPFIPVLVQIVDLFKSADVRAQVQVIGESIGYMLKSVADFAFFVYNAALGAWRALTDENRVLILSFIGFGLVITSLIATMGIVTVVVSALITPFTIIVTTLAAVSAAWTTNFYNIQSVTASVASEISSILSGLASDATDWGVGIVSAVSEGIAGAVSLVIDALSVIGAALTFWLAPGSPPRLLPELDTWGKDAAEVYLQGWTTADFSALKDITSIVDGLLSASGKKNSGASVAAELMGPVSDAIQEVVKFGKVSDQSYAAIRSAAGDAAEETIALVRAYELFLVSSKQVEAIQSQITASTRAYEAQLRPLQQRLQEISNIRSSSDDQKELTKLNRVLASQYASDARKKQAALRIEEIQLNGQIRTIEQRRNTEQNANQTRLDAVTVAQEAAQKELDLLKERIGVEKTYADYLAATKAGITSAGEASAKAAKAGLSELDKQLKSIKLQRDEMGDLKRLAELQLVLESDKSTELEKQNAKLEIQQIKLEQQQRRLEAVEIGLDPASLDALASVPITLEDIQKKGKGANEELAQMTSRIKEMDKPLNDLLEADPAAEFAKFSESLKEARKEMDLLTISISAKIAAIDALLPSFLSLKGEAGGLPPIIKTLGAAFAGFVASKSVGKLVSVFGMILTSTTSAKSAFGVLGLAVGLFTSAWVGNWGDIRGAISTAFGGITLDSEKIKNSLIGLLPFLPLVLGGFRAFASRVVGSFYSIARFLLNPANLLNTRGLSSELKILGGKFASEFSRIGSSIYSYVSKPIALISRMFRGLASFVSTVARGAFSLLGRAIVGSLSLAARFVIGSLVLPFKVAIAIVKGFVFSILGIPSAIKLLVRYFGIAISYIIIGFLHVASAIVNATKFIYGLISGVISFRSVISRTLGFIWSLVRLVFSGLPAIFSAIRSGAIYAFSIVRSAISSLPALFSILRSAAVTAFSFIGRIAMTLLSPSRIFGALWSGIRFAVGLLLNLRGVFGLVVQAVMLGVRTLLGPVSLIIAGVTLLYYAWVGNWFGIQEYTQAAVDKILLLWTYLTDGSFLTDLSTWWAGVRTSIDAELLLMTNAWNLFAASGYKFSALLPYLTDLWTRFSGWITTKASEIYVALTTQWVPAMVDWLSDVWFIMQVKFNDLMSSIKFWIAVNSQSISTDLRDRWLPALWAWLTSAATEIGMKLTTEWIPAFIGWIPTLWTSAIVPLANFLKDMVIWIATTGAPILIENLLLWSATFIDWVGDAAINILPKLAGFIGDIVQWIIGTGIPLLIGGLAGMAVALWGWITGEPGSGVLPANSPWGRVGGALLVFLGKISETIVNEIIPAIIISGGTIIEGLLKGIVDMIANFGASDAAARLKNLGGDIVGGIKEGITNKWTDFTGWWGDLMGGIVDKGMDIIGAHSPSKETEDKIGKPIVQGIIEGMLGVDIISQVSTLMLNLVGAFVSGLTSITVLFITFTSGVVALVVPMLTFLTTSVTAWSLTWVAIYTTMLTNVALLFQAMQITVTTTVALMSATLSSTLSLMHVALMLIIEQFRTDATISFALLRDDVSLAMVDMSSRSVSAADTLRNEVYKKFYNEGEPKGLYQLVKKDFVDKGVELGEDWVKGIAQGINDNLGLLTTAGENAADAVNKAFESTQKIDSPSKVARDDLGLPWVQGISIGITRNIPMIVDAAMQVNDVLVSEFFTIGQNIVQALIVGIASGSMRIGSMIDQYMPVSSASQPSMMNGGTVIHNTKNYYLTVNSSESSASIVGDFRRMEMLAL